MRPEHLLGLDGCCQRCHAPLGRPPLPQPSPPLLVDRVAPPARAPEVLRHEITVAPEILEPKAAPAAPAIPAVEEPQEGHALTPVELTQLCQELRKSIKAFLDSKDEDDAFRTGVVLWAGVAYVGFNPDWIADFADLPRAFCRERVARLRAQGVVAGHPPRLVPLVRERFQEDGAKSVGKRGRGGHKRDPMPFVVRFCCFVLVAQGLVEYRVEDDYFRSAGLDAAAS